MDIRWIMPFGWTGGGGRRLFYTVCDSPRRERLETVDAGSWSSGDLRGALSHYRMAESGGWWRWLGVMIEKILPTGKELGGA